MGSLARTIHTTASLSTSTMKIVLAFCLVAAFACTAESRSHGKINAFLKRMEKTVAKVQDADYDDCDVDGGDGYLYWCPGDGSGSCCTHPAGNGNDGDFVCCDFSDYPTICAYDAATCEI